MTLPKHTLLTALALFAIGCTDPNAGASECSPGQTQDCSDNPPDYSIQAVEDIARFCEQGCLHVRRLSIASLPDVTELDAFNHIIHLGSFNYSYLADLKVLDGFSSVQDMGGATLSLGQVLEEIHGFDALKKIAFDLTIEDHPELRAITGFQNLRQVGEIQEPLDEDLPTEQRHRLEISNANQLTDLSGFSNLEVVNFFALRHLGALPSMEGFGSLRETKHFILHDLASLESLDGLESMAHIHHSARFLDLPKVKRCEIEVFLEGLETQPIDLMIERVNEAPCD